MLTFGEYWGKSTDTNRQFGKMFSFHYLERKHDMGDFRFAWSPLKHKEKSLLQLDNLQYTVYTIVLSV